MGSRESILVVDDAPENILIVRELLRELYRIKVATGGEKALQVARSVPPPDLILLDIIMPGLDGYQVCQRLKADPLTREIPIIFLTVKSDIEAEQRGLELGAVDYITKPISPPILLARIKTHLQLKEANDFLHQQNTILEQKVQQRTRQLAILQDCTMVAMGSLAETRDNETGNHIRRTQRYIKALALGLIDQQQYSELLTDEYVELIFKSAPLHDIGKVGVPDKILLKPGKLTDEEFEEMKKHTVYGRDAILAAESKLTDDQAGDFLRLAEVMAYSHQERWDGSGYPEGLAGKAIPMPARLMAVADVYDALISRRVYKEPIAHEQATEIIAEGKGSHFDPDIVDAFLRVSDQFREISLDFSDELSDLHQGQAELL